MDCGDSNHIPGIRPRDSACRVMGRLGAGSRAELGAVLSMQS